MALKGLRLWFSNLKNTEDAKNNWGKHSFFWSLFGEWLVALMRHVKIGRLLVQSIIGTQPRLGAQPCYNISDELLVIIRTKTQQLTLGERSCTLKSGPELAMEQPRSTYKNKNPLNLAVGTLVFTLFFEMVFFLLTNFKI